MPTTDAGLLSVKGLCLRNVAGRNLVSDLSFTVGPGETVALVGESGSGKSLTAKAIIGLLPKGITASGEILLGSEDLQAASAKRMREVRGGRVGLLLQDPFTMLNPLIRVGTLLGETLCSQRRAAGEPKRSSAELKIEIRRRLQEVGLAAGTDRKYPWELSGGMRQRVGLAATVAKDPALLIADEPTTALDATTQREVLLLLKRIQEERGMGLLLITHDLRVAFSLSDRVLVMSQGCLLEDGDPDTLREDPKTEYTKKLLAADLPRGYCRTELPVVDRRPLLKVENLRKQFNTRQRKTAARTAWALKGVSLELQDGVNVGVIGESGSGKTTLARCLLGLERPTSGTMEVDGRRYENLADLSRRDQAAVRSTMQCVFQDPYSSLNPSHSIGYILAEAIKLRAHHDIAPEEVAAETEALLGEVELPADFVKRLPVSLSGGQRQRVAIARALAMRPRILLCDEPVAALDASVQAQVLELLRKVQAGGVNLLFITHDLPVVRQMTDELVVLFRGEVAERGRTADVIDNPQHAYTKRLLAAVPTGTRDWLREETNFSGGQL
ncbi:ABC transporter ATP-binding protein [Kribbella yunnanensis]|uniref:ABC transporter ATP-binding protein n=1 Tax=Kribbella yunnanensis TaxID=190194 RepID=A0ABP4V0H1_9ACTN